MISDGIRFTNLDSDYVELGTTISPYSLEGFDPKVDQRVNGNRTKMQRHGLWPSFTYEGGMVIDINGAILADDSDDYNTKRVNLITIIRGDPDTLISVRRMGTLRVIFDGQAEDWETHVTLQEFSAPLEGDSPMYSEYMITFLSFNSWFVGVDTGSKYRYA